MRGPRPGLTGPGHCADCSAITYSLWAMDTISYWIDHGCLIATHGRARSTALGGTFDGRLEALTAANLTRTDLTLVMNLSLTANNREAAVARDDRCDVDERTKVPGIRNLGSISNVFSAVCWCKPVGRCHEPLSGPGARRT